MKNSKLPTMVYPELGAEVDLWFARMSGHGLGNCFYCYFHAVVLAEQVDATVISPAWFSLKLGPLLRGESSKRLYWRMFKAYTSEISGLSKLLRLCVGYRQRKTVEIGTETNPVLERGVLNVVVSRRFTFTGLHAHRRLIRDRLIGIIRDPLPANFSWGSGQYIAVHVRLGDFAKASDPAVVSTGLPNVRIPLSWYVTVITALRHRYSSLKVYVFSDGQAEELRALTSLGAELYRSGSDMTDLLAMSGASILVGSNSTYSRWAAFLGDMPSIWLKKHTEDEKPSASQTPILFVGIDEPQPELWRQDVLKELM